MRSNSIEIQQKANLFNEVMRLVTQGQQPTVVGPTKTVTMVGRQVTLRTADAVASLDLAARPLSQKLIQLFLDSPDHKLDRQAIIEGIYEVNLASNSSRMTQSLSNNAVKLISRTRNLCNENLGFGGRLKWFVHSGDYWHLMHEFY